MIFLSQSNRNHHLDWEPKITVGYTFIISSQIQQAGVNRMLRHAFESLEGSNILWHIVSPPPARPAHFPPDLV